jgi:Rod binding domain-containing protein
MDMINNEVQNILLNSKYDKFKDTINSGKNGQLKEVCDEFESFFMQKIYDVALKDSKIAGEGTGSDIIKGMYTQSLSQKSSGTLGISDILYKFLSQNNGKKV